MPNVGLSSSSWLRARRGAASSKLVRNLAALSFLAILALVFFLAPISPCGTCDGTGRFEDFQCPACKGGKKFTLYRKVMHAINPPEEQGGAPDQ